MMTGVDALTTYCSDVPSIGFICGVPSNVIGFAIEAERCTVAVCGIEFATTASFACGVPGTEALTFSTGLSSGIFAKSGGRLAFATYCQGPAVEGAENQRPEMRTYVFWLSMSLNTRPVVLVT